MTIITVKNMTKRTFSFSSDIVNSYLGDLYLFQLLKCLSFIKRVRVKENGKKRMGKRERVKENGKRERVKEKG